MNLSDVPHLAFPIQVRCGQYIVNQQGSQAEAVTQVRVILAFERESRIESPDFGIIDPTFERMPVDLDDISRAISEFAPEVDYVIDTVIDELSGKEQINIKVTLPYADDDDDWPEDDSV